MMSSCGNQDSVAAYRQNLRSASAKRSGMHRPALPKNGYTLKYYSGSGRTIWGTNDKHRQTFQKMPTHPLQYESERSQNRYHAHAGQLWSYPGKYLSTLPI